MAKKKRKHEKSEMRSDRDDMMLERGFLDAPSAAKLLGVSTARAYALAKEPDVVTQRLGGSVYFSRDSLAHFRHQRRPPPGWIPLAEAMRRSHYSRSTIYQRADAGEIDMQRFGGRTCVREATLAALTL